MVQVIKHLAGAGTEADPVGPDALGRAASKVESLEDMIAELSSRAGRLAGASYSRIRGGACVSQDGPRESGGAVVGQSTTASFAAFKPIEPSRLQFLGSPTFDPRPYLDPVTRAVFEDPGQFAVPSAEYSGVVPKARFTVAMTRRSSCSDSLTPLVGSNSRFLPMWTRGTVPASFQS